MPDQDFERRVAGQLAEESAQGPQMRAPTWREKISDVGQSVYETVAEQPLARLLDLLGASDFGGTAKSFTDPNAGVKRGEMPGGPGKDVAKVLKGIRAYHGSPHDFDRFATEKIGTGEGAQAYGHGLYFAENEGVAKGYRDALKPQGSELPEHTAWLAAGRDYSNALDKHLARPTAESRALVTSAQDAHKRAATALSEARAKAGRMYEVNINADPEHFYDWDKPLSEQPQKVREALQQLQVERTIKGPMEVRQNIYGDKQFYLVNRKSGEWGTDAFPSREAAEATLPEESFRQQVMSPTDSGGAAYEKLSEALGGSDVASARLREAGVPGIRYLDRGSRAAGEGTYNYSVSDEKLITILRKYGVAAALAAGYGADQIRQAQAAGGKQ